MLSREEVIELGHRQRIIACDFDGTIAANDKPFPEIGKPNMMIIRALKYEKSLGSIIILWTCRAGKFLDMAVDFCKSHGLEFDAINDEAPGLWGESKKIVATEYWDDRAFHVQDVMDMYCDLDETWDGE